MALDPQLPCGGPCPEFDRCPVCDAYWTRMVDDGLWEPDRHEWTDTAVREWLK